MASSSAKTFDFKLAGSLFAVLLVSFIIMILSFNFFQSSRTTKVADQISAAVDQLGRDQASAAKIDEIKKTVHALSSDSQSGILLKMSGVAVGCLIVVMAVMGLLFKYLLFKPLSVLNTSLENSIKGNDRDLTVRLALDRDDEVGKLSKCFDAFMSNLDEMIMNIGSKTETIAASASEVFVASEQMDEESSDLYARSNSVAAAAEEMNASMHTVAAASEEASTNIGMVAQAAVQMQSNISSVAQNCDQAREISNKAKLQVDEATRKVETLGEAAREITNVTQVITEIAEQTNLLALNATIEAARAGEAGKGFAVVASEIKSLASQTAQATMSIREKIESIQNSTKDTVDQVGSISQVIASVDEIVNEIARSIEEQSNTATEVATNIEQASIGISEVNQNVAQSSQVASEIATDIADVDNIASDMSDRATLMTKGAKDLDALSMDLRSMISVFRVSGKTKAAVSSSGLDQKNIPDLMPWSSKFQTKIEKVDTQHKELVRLVNLLHKAMRLQKGASEVGGILNDLAQYTVFHFRFEEEELFKKYKYPEYEAHKKIHKDLVAQVGAFQEAFKSGKATVSMDLMDFLKDWLKNHIMKTDMAYAPFIINKMKNDSKK
ncbi:MAG: bacteriohemerythrin [Pseudomonadota bacterium]